MCSNLISNLAPTPLEEWVPFHSKERKIYVKYEHLNPTGSLKDRMVGYVLSRSIEKGLLRQGMTIVEASSGNTGAALAHAAAQIGFATIIFTAASTAKEKISAIKELGGDVRVVETSKEAGEEIRQAKSRGQKLGYFYFNQFENPFHVEAYESSLAEEIVTDLTKKKITVDTFLSGLGTGASLLAVGRKLKSANPNLKIYAVSPSRVPTDIEGLHPGHLVRGGHFKIWRERPRGFENDVLFVDDKDAYSKAIEIKERTSVSVGPATGASLHAALKLPAPGNVLIIATDAGHKYGEKYASWLARNQKS